MKMSNKIYDIIKWAVITGLPVASFVLSGLADIYGWDLNAAVATVNLFTAALGMIIGISSVKYSKSLNEAEEEKQDD